jgi:hypothetical protein
VAEESQQTRHSKNCCDHRVKRKLALKRRWGATCTQPTESNPFPPTPQPHKNKKHKKYQILSPTHNLQSFGKNLQFHESDVLKFRWVRRHLIKDLEFLGCKFNNPKEDYKQLQFFWGRFDEQRKPMRMLERP